MSAQHTPGPWEAKQWTDEDADIYGWYFSAGDYLVPLSDMETDDPAICDANARLIAAAPALLAALQLAKNSLVAFKFMPGSGNAWEAHDEANLEAVNAAIAAATGAQP